MDAYGQRAEQQGRLILPLLSFLDTFTGIVVFVLPPGSFLPTRPSRIMARVAKFFFFTSQAWASKGTRRKLWEHAIRRRLTSQEGFMTILVVQHLWMLEEHRMDWETIQSIVHAVVPRDTKPEEVNGKLLAQLSEEYVRVTQRPEAATNPVARVGAN